MFKASGFHLLVGNKSFMAYTTGFLSIRLHPSIYRLILKRFELRLLFGNKFLPALDDRRLSGHPTYHMLSPANPCKMFSMHE